jgi:hypothetical protein
MRRNKGQTFRSDLSGHCPQLELEAENSQTGNTFEVAAVPPWRSSSRGTSRECWLRLLGL